MLVLAAVAASRLATPLRAQTDDLLTFQFQIGKFVPPPVTNDDDRMGTGPGEFTFPFGIAVDSTGRFIVTDTESYSGPMLESNRVQVFLADGTFERELGGRGELGGQFWYPTAAAVDALDQIVIADAGNHRIQVLSPATSAGGPQFLAEYGRFGNYDPLDSTSNYPAPAPPDEFYFPASVALKPGTRLLDPTDTTGRIAIVDNGNHRVVVLNSQLQYVGEFGGHTSDDNPPGTFEYPWGAAIGQQGEYYVTDPSNHRVQVFSALGQFLWTFGADTNTAIPGPGDLSSPSAVGFEGNGRLMVVDADRSRLLRVDLVTDVGAGSGVPLCADVVDATIQKRCIVTTSDGHRHEALVLGGFGSGETEFKYPQGVAADAAGRIAVADTNHHLVKVFQPAKIEVREATATAGPSGARVDEPITLHVTLANTGGSALDVTLSIDASLAGTLSGVASAPIEPGAEHTFVVTFVPDQAGTLSFTVGAEGLHATGARIPAAPVDIAPIEVAPALGPKLLVILAADRSSVGTGQTFALTVRLVNSGNTTFQTIAPVVSASPAGLVAPVPGEPLDLSPLEPGTRDLTYSYTALQEGTVSFTVAVTATYVDPDNPPSSLPYPAPPAPPVSDSIGGIAIHDDVTPPVTTVTLSAEADPSGWHRAPFTATLSADDDSGSGVRTITYHLVGLEITSVTTTENPVSLQIYAQGMTSLTYYATDRNGYSESPQTRTFRLDSVPPAMGRAVVVPVANAAGWNNTDVVVKFVAGDGTSGIASITPPVTVTTEGAGQIVKGTARDAAGNESETQAVLNIDKTPPVLAFTLSHPPNASGWHNQPVTVTFTAADQPGLSGVAFVTPPQTVSADGITVVTGVATDVAGNTSVRTVIIKIDQTPPSISCRTVSGGLIWPPNHKLVPWQTSVLVTDLTSGSGGFVLTATSSSEADDAPRGDGRTTGDIQGFIIGTPDTFGYVRSERSGRGDGRTYSLFYEGRDLAGNVTACSVVTAEVPHDQGSVTKATAKRK